MVLAGGADALAEYQRALDEWRLLTAAALVGLVEETMTIAAEFAKSRYTLGVPIGTLQGISHPLANIAITVQSGRGLARRAAWFLDNEPDERPELAPLCVRVHGRGGRQGRHHGGTRSRRARGGPAEAAATAYLVGPAAGHSPVVTRVPPRCTSPESLPARESRGLRRPWISQRVELSAEDEALPAPRRASSCPVW